MMLRRARLLFRLALCAFLPHRVVDADEWSVSDDVAGDGAGAACLGEEEAMATSSASGCEGTTVSFTMLSTTGAWMALTVAPSSVPPVRARRAADVPITARTKTQPMTSTVQVERQVTSTRNRAMP